jgi:TRAP-type C4-dicarboxylate transport system substrate-binding protein
MYQPLLMNKSAYDGLTDEQKKALEAGAAKAEAFYLEEAKKQDAASAEVFQEGRRGDREHDAGRVRRLARPRQGPSYKNFVEQTPGGQELLDMALSVE